ncbi:hypothetical protein BDR06DRAFT_885466, partial [Suillus hirtellus]
STPNFTDDLGLDNLDTVKVLYQHVLLQQEFIMDLEIPEAEVDKIKTLQQG